MTRVWTYALKKPNDVKIKQLIGKDTYTYIVATKAMARERRALLPADQTNKENKSVAVFQDVISLWLEKAGEPIATKNERNVLLRRAIDDVTTQDPSLTDILKTDLSSWLKALGNLAETGTNLTHGWLPDKHASLVNPFVGDLLEKLQKAYYEQLGSSGRVLFEEAARRYFRQQYAPTQVVILEGFTFLTELQKLYVKECTRLGARIEFIVPFRKEQSRVFEQIRQTYHHVINWNDFSENENISSQPDIHALQSELMTSSRRKIDLHDNLVKLASYPSRDREMLACINQIREWLNSGFNPEQIAVVMRSPGDFKEQFRDMLHLHPIHYRDEQGSLHEISMPKSPRLLLLTPVGRFILTLYQIWKQNQLDMSADNFESIISSGWLGVELQDSANRFRAIKPQRFAHVKSFREWNYTLDELNSQRGSKVRLPDALAIKDEIYRWKETVKLLESVCRKLFSTKGTFKDHIRILQNELESIVPENIRKSEKEVLDQIREAFRELENTSSFPITTDEFGDSIHAITRSSSNEQDEENEEELLYDSIRIMSPESIDGQVYPCIWYLGTDNLRVPLPPTLPWPFFEDGRESHLNKERYMFVTVLRAAQTQIILSYSREDAGRSYEASIYLHEIERKFQLQMTHHDWKDTLELLEAPVISPRAQTYALGLKDTYTLNEIAHYGVCPLRYHLETLHPEASVYRSEWQLTKATQGIWLMSILERLTEQNSALNVESIVQKADQLRQEVKVGLKKQFPSFDAVTWEEVEQRVWDSLISNLSYRPEYPKRVKLGKAFSWKVAIDGQNDFVDINTNIPFILQSGRYDSPIVSPILHQEWLLPGKKESGDFNESDGLKSFNSHYHAVQWWIKTHRSLLVRDQNPLSSKLVLDLQEHMKEANTLIGFWVEQIRNNLFPKRPGEHCRNCSVRSECLGLQSELIQGGRVNAN